MRSRILKLGTPPAFSENPGRKAIGALTSCIERAGVDVAVDGICEWMAPRIDSWMSADPISENMWRLVRGSRGMSLEEIANALMEISNSWMRVEYMSKNPELYGVSVQVANCGSYDPGGGHMPNWKLMAACLRLLAARMVSRARARAAAQEQLLFKGWLAPWIRWSYDWDITWAEKMITDLRYHEGPTSAWQRIYPEERLCRAAVECCSTVCAAEQALAMALLSQRKDAPPVFQIAYRRYIGREMGNVGPLLRILRRVRNEATGWQPKRRPRRKKGAEE